MKKLIVLLMMAIMVVSLTACGSSKEESGENKTSQKKEETVAETDITMEITEEQTVEETTKKKAKKIQQPKNISKCASAEEAASPVCDGLMDDDLSQIGQTVPEDYKGSKKITTFKNELTDVLYSLEEMTEVGVVYTVSTTGTQEPENATVQSINADFKSMGIKYKVTELKNVIITVSLEMDDSTQTQEIICLTGKIGKYWYMIGSDE